MFSKRLIVAVVVAGAALVLGRNVTLDSDLARLLPDTDPELERVGDVLRRVMERTIVEVVPDEADAVAERLRPHVKSVRTGAREGDVLELVETLRKHAPLLIGDLAYDEIKRRLEPAQVEKTLHHLARRLQEPDGAYLAARASWDPLGITDLALAPLAAFTAGLKDARIVNGRLVSADGKHTLLFVEPGFPPTDTERTEAFLKELEGTRHLGTHRATYDNARQMERDVKLTMIAGVALVALIAWLVFKRIGVALMAMLPAVYGAIVALGVYALFRDEIAAAVAGLAAALLGITFDYAIHVFYSSKVPARAILMGATTTGAAFLALRVSSVPGIREIGTFGAIGVCGAALFAILVLPPRGKRKPLDLSRAVDVLQSRGALLAVAVLTPVLAWGATRARMDGDVQRLSRLSPAAAEDEQAILEHWGDAFRVTTLVVSGDTLEQALQKNDALLKRLEGKEHASIAGMLPSRRTQARRLAKWRAFWTDQRLLETRKALHEGIPGTPFRIDAFDEFFSFVRPADEWLTPNDLPAELVKDRLLPDNAIATPVFGAEYEEFEDWDGVLVVNREALVKKLATLVGEETLHLGLAALAAVAIILSLWLQRFARALLVLAPLLLSCLWTFGLLGLFGVPITLANAIFVAFLFGLAVDYSIFLMHARLELRRTGDNRTAETDSAVLLCALTTLAGFGVLTLAGHPVLSSIGVTALCGIGSAIVVTQALMPRLVRPRPPFTLSASIRDLYDEAGPIIRRYAPSKAKRDPVVKAAPELAADARDILVAGCGYGIVTAQLVLAGKPVRAIDVDKRKLAVAQSALRDFDVSLDQGDLFATDLGAPDCIFAIDLLHYWSETKQEAMLRRLVDALQPGGTLVFRDGCLGARGHKWVRRYEALATATGFTRAGDGFCFRTRDGWLTLMADCGSQVESERDDLGLGSNLVLVCRKRK